MLTVERVGSLPGDADLAPAWGELLARCPWRSLFLTYDWTLTWWEHFGAGSELWLLVVREGPEIVGIAPMRVTRERYGGLPVRTLGFLRNRHTSRSDFILPERRREALRALVRYWREHAGEWDVLRLVGMDEASGAVSLALEELRSGGLDPFPPRPHRRLDYLPVAGDWPRLVGSWSYRFRRSRALARNRLERAGQASFARDCGPDEVAGSMDRLFALEARSWKSDSALAAFDERDRRFHRALAARLAPAGGFENLFLVLDGQTIAGLHSLIHDRVRYLMLTYYDPEHRALSPGRQVMEAALEISVTEGRVREVDLNGTSPLLQSWATHSRSLMSLSACSRRPYSRMVAGLKRLKRLIEDGELGPARSAAPAAGTGAGSVGR